MVNSRGTWPSGFVCVVKGWNGRMNAIVMPLVKEMTRASAPRLIWR